ncbi:prepro-carboxypeptidase Z [Phascolomyces articulosus]|uniref:Carboxypeptidase n=1 Tax=Phascolomyces articulosus TaxID=60185 RepID=A0AAD5PA33_9FUNG|nr:prepro-carboxypeptidase Z [Phascolomyces articulosus]
MITLTSKRNPNLSIRYTQPELCDPNVIQYSGYFDIQKEDVHYFFWFFESKAENAPLTLWLNGGPGCSSMGGLFTGPGPCKVTDNGIDIKAVYNPYSWHRYSNILFLDQPAGTGFSYGTGTINRTEDGATYVYESLQLFFEIFPQYIKLPFHMFGESYAGRYVSEYARYILEKNSMIKNNNESSSASIAVEQIILLESVAFGNPHIDPFYHYQSSPQMACNSTNPFTAPPETCKRMSEIFEEECAPLLKQCSATNSVEDCHKARNICVQIERLFDATGQSSTDVRIPSVQDTPPQTYARFLNLPSTRKHIGANALYTECKASVRIPFLETGDNARKTSPSITFLLNQGIRVLVFVGDVDYLCNWYGNNALFNALPWYHADHYRAQSLKPWMLNSREVGQIKSWGPLTFIRVYQAGHDVPYYQPLPSLAMFQAWIKNITLNPLQSM